MDACYDRGAPLYCLGSSIWELKTSPKTASEENGLLPDATSHGLGYRTRIRQTRGVSVSDDFGLRGHVIQTIFQTKYVPSIVARVRV